MTQEHSPALDLNLRKWERNVGNVTIIGTWTLHNKRPCLVLVPSNVSPYHDRITPCVVTLDNAFMWDEHTGDPADVAILSYQFAAALGMNPNEPRNVLFVTTLIRDSLDDLITGIGPFPESERVAVADALITDPNTGKTKEAEIKDHV